MRYSILITRPNTTPYCSRQFKRWDNAADFLIRSALGAISAQPEMTKIEKARAESRATNFNFEHGGSFEIGAYVAFVTVSKG